MHVESLMIQGQSIVYRHYGQRNGAGKSCWKEMMRKQVLGKGKWNLLILIRFWFEFKFMSMLMISLNNLKSIP